MSVPQRPRAALLPLLTNASRHPVRPVQVDAGVWIVGYDRFRVTRAEVAGIVRHLFQADVAVIDEPGGTAQ
ncbi:hypothetical protein ACFVXG_20300 [Kitasatospora sp. NPDC058162]|uniref:hypothetical protein n=1 Tax=Kitasatospora sp. NPDC058162 TaxID=3346362 RepID=UPI0036D8D57E